MKLTWPSAVGPLAVASPRRKRPLGGPANCSLLQVELAQLGGGWKIALRFAPEPRAAGQHSQAAFLSALSPPEPAYLPSVGLAGGSSIAAAVAAAAAATLVGPEPGGCDLQLVRLPLPLCKGCRWQSARARLASPAPSRRLHARLANTQTHNGPTCALTCRLGQNKLAAWPPTRSAGRHQSVARGAAGAPEAVAAAAAAALWQSTSLQPSARALQPELNPAETENQLPGRRGIEAGSCWRTFIGRPMG